MALTASGEVIGWGTNSNGALDIPSDLSDVVQIAAGEYFSLALTSSGEVVGWGHN